MRRPNLQVVLLFVGVALFAWPGMMLLHEVGYVSAASATGGRVTRIVWHPLAFSRTDVSPNPRPMVVVWAGPIAGCVLTILLERLVAFISPGILYIARLFAGFCLIANGAYISLGGFERVWDSGDMLKLGTPWWVMITFGVLACGVGLWQWHLASFHVGSVRIAAAHIPMSHMAWTLVVGALLNLLMLIFGDRGM
jgi:hypothetical protein